MKIQRSIQLIVLAISFSIAGYGMDSSSLPKDIKYKFSVSMEQPGNHYFHVELTCTDQKVDFIDFKMPVWTPGYYKIQNLSKNVVNFKAMNVEGLPLSFIKTQTNTWRVNTKKEKTVIISYDFYANELAVVESYLDASKAFISPTGIFMFPAGQISQASLVTLNPHKTWKSISTGLDEVSDQPNTYFASDFDVLFDCPILLGNHQIIKFDVNKIPYELAVSEEDTLGKTRFVTDLTKIIQTTTALIGDVPYKHYTFLTLGSRGGGLEHQNSCALSCSGSVGDTTNMDGYKGWLSFVTHEYFHLYNVKAIRPIALGPFDYDKENYTNMLWVSEGITVYYEYLILNRAGIIDRNECYKYLTESISAYENRPGHLMESVTSSSFDAWIHFFDPTSDARNNTISYYDKGCAMGLFIDLKIRNATQNKKSLDDVMRGLYFQYYKDLKRGFTDDEFKSLCEKTAGTSLTEIFDYASTVQAIDYPKYLDLAGLAIDTTAHQVEGKVYFGASFRTDGVKFTLFNVERNSPAWKAGLGNDVEVLKIEGEKANKEVFAYILKTKKAGDSLDLIINEDGTSVPVKAILASKTERTFKIEPQPNASSQQKSLLDFWLK